MIKEKSITKDKSECLLEKTKAFCLGFHSFKQYQSQDCGFVAI